MRRIVFFVAFIVAVPLSLHPHGAPRAPFTDLELTTRSTSPRFVINSVPTFLVMVSYFDGMDQGGSNINTDMAFLASKGVNGVRVMANWWDAALNGSNFPTESYSYSSTTLCDGNGDLRTGPTSALLGLLDDAKDEGLIVDLTFTAETVSGLTLEEYTDCIVEFTGVLAGGGSAYKHVFFDVQNEYDNSNNGPSDANPMSEGEIATLVTAIKTEDPDRLVTVSTTQQTASNALNLIDGTGIDIVAYHQNRLGDPIWWSLTAAAIGTLDNLDLPVYMQEPLRIRPSESNEGWATAANWAMDAYLTKTNGGDAWTLHNGASFELGSWTLASVMQSEELLFLDCLNSGSVFYDGSCEAPAPRAAALLRLWPRGAVATMFQKPRPSMFRR